MKPIKLNDEFNTVIHPEAGDDEAKVKKFYEDKLSKPYTMREETKDQFNQRIPTTKLDGNLFN